MPAVASLSEFNRNQTALIDTLEKTQEPIYLTRNGKASVVVMDAAAFDRMVSAKERAQKREMDVYQGLMRGYADVLDGKTSDAKSALGAIREKRAGSVSYNVEITDYAADFIEQNVALESVLRRFEWAVEMLSAFPSLGPAYDPEYIAARPPFSCRYLPLPDTPFYALLHGG